MRWENLIGIRGLFWSCDLTPKVVGGRGKARRAAHVVAVVTFTALPLWPGSFTHAEESSFCVTCQEPDGAYHCQTKHGRGMSRSVMKYGCIVQIAKAGGHGSCAVSHVRADLCRGEPRQVDFTDLPGFFGGPAARDNADQTPQPLPRAEGPPQDPSLGERPSVARMTNRAIRASRNGMASVVENRPVRAAAQKTGSRLGRMARCAGRLFWKCRERENSGGEIEPLPAPAE